MLIIPENIIVKYEGSFINSSTLNRVREEARRITLLNGVSFCAPPSSILFVLVNGHVEKTHISDLRIDDLVLVPKLKFHLYKSLDNLSLKEYRNNNCYSSRRSLSISESYSLNILNKFSLRSEQDIRSFIEDNRNLNFSREGNVFIQALQIISRERFNEELFIRKKENGYSYVKKKYRFTKDHNGNIFIPITSIEKLSNKKQLPFIDDEIAFTSSSIFLR